MVTVNHLHTCLASEQAIEIEREGEPDESLYIFVVHCFDIALCW